MSRTNIETATDATNRRLVFSGQLPLPQVVVSRHDFTSPGQKPSGGLFAYKGFDYLITIKDDRFQSVLLNLGSPVQVEWRWKDEIRKDWSRKSLAILITKLFIRHWIENGRVEWNDQGKARLVPRGEKVAHIVSGPLDSTAALCGHPGSRLSCQTRRVGATARAPVSVG
jgi:hypothetical protein